MGFLPASREDKRKSGPATRPLVLPTDERTATARCADDVTFMNLGSGAALHDSTLKHVGFPKEAFDDSLAFPANEDMSMRLAVRYRGGADAGTSIRRLEQVDAPPANSQVRRHE